MKYSFFVNKEILKSQVADCPEIADSVDTRTCLTCTVYAMGWLRLVGSWKLSVSFAEYGLFYRALLPERPIILRGLLIVATPYSPDDPTAVFGLSQYAKPKALSRRNLISFPGKIEAGFVAKRRNDTFGACTTRQKRLSQSRAGSIQRKSGFSTKFRIGRGWFRVARGLSPSTCEDGGWWADQWVIDTAKGIPRVCQGSLLPLPWCTYYQFWIIHFTLTCRYDHDWWVVPTIRRLPELLSLCCKMSYICRICFQKRPYNLSRLLHVIVATNT